MNTEGVEGREGAEGGVSAESEVSGTFRHDA